MASVAPKPNKALLYIANDLGGTQKYQNIKHLLGKDKVWKFCISTYITKIRQKNVHK